MGGSVTVYGKAKAGIRTVMRLSVPISIVLFMLLSSVPLVAADGVPAVPRDVFYEEEPEKVFKSIFESRQLALVELVNDTHERISLFISVYSLDPGGDLHVLVPLRTLPEDVNGRPIKEREFRDEFSIDKTEEEIRRQDPEEGWSRVGHWSHTACEFAFGSMLWTMPGEYVRQTVHPKLRDWDLFPSRMLNADSDEATGSGSTVEQHYEFDGFSIDVIGVSSGPALEDYLEQRDLVVPAGTSFDDYMDHYLAVIDAKAEPPIDETQFQQITQVAPELVDYLVMELERKPVRNESQLEDLKMELIQKFDLRDQDMRGIYWVLSDLVDAVFGVVEFEGEVIEIELPLHEGKMFFPLGTSGGWSNEVGDIDILFKVPEDKGLDIPDTKDAFFDGHHWYLFQMQHANPDFDLESKVLPVSSERLKESKRAAYLFDNAKVLGSLIALLVVIIAWLVIAYIIRRVMKKDEPLLKNPVLWTMLGLSLIISLPAALLIYLLVKPLPIKELAKHHTTFAMTAIYPVVIAAFAIGVAL
jgi:hypothetical protein